MIKPPYTKWINDIKTKLGFNRTMTASGEDVVDAVNKQSQQIDDLTDDVGDINALQTAVTTNLVAALNDVNSKLLENSVTDVTPIRTTGAYTANITFNYFKCIKIGRFVTVYGQFVPSESFSLEAGGYVRYQLPFVCNTPSTGLLTVLNNGKTGECITRFPDNLNDLQFSGLLQDGTFIQANQIVNFTISYIS